jgi:hypothetical protein
MREDRMQSSSQQENTPIPGSLDGTGAGDHDMPYRFGWRPSASTSFPFSTREYARLLVLRSRIREGLLFADDLAPA